MDSKPLTSARTAGELVRDRRRQRGLTQQQLAEKAGVSRKFVSEFEAGHDRAELGKAMRVMEAAGLGLQARDEPSQAESLLEEHLAALRTEVSTHGSTDFALRLLARTVTVVVDLGERASHLQRPRSMPSSEWENLLRASLRYGFRKSGVPAPAWTAPERLDTPWLPAKPSSPRYTDLTYKQTPPELAEANIFLREKTLSSA